MTGNDDTGIPEIKAVTETAKAAQEIAKTTGQGIEAAGNLVGYFGKVLGSLPEDLVGLAAGDWLHETRMRNRERLAERTEELLRARGRDPKEYELSPSVLLPLVLAGQDEIRDELQELYARLIANAVDPARASSVRRHFIGLVQQMEPLDARLLMEIAAAPMYLEWLQKILQRFPDAPQAWSGRDAANIYALLDPAALMGQNPDAIELAIENLKILKCIEIVEPGTRKDGNVLRGIYDHCAKQVAGELTDFPEQVYFVSFPTLGRELLRALKE